MSSPLNGAPLFKSALVHLPFTGVLGGSLLPVSLAYAWKRDQTNSACLLPEGNVFGSLLRDVHPLRLASLKEKHFSSSFSVVSYSSREKKELPFSLLSSIFQSMVIYEGDSADPGTDGNEGFHRSIPLHLVFFSPTVEDIQRVRVLMAHLISSGVMKNAIWPVLWGDLSSELNEQTVEEKVGGIRGTLPLEESVLMKAANQGVLIQHAKASSALSKALSRLVQSMDDYFDHLEGSSGPAPAVKPTDIKGLERVVVERVWRRLHETDYNSTSKPTFVVEQELNAALIEHPSHQFQPTDIKAMRQRIEDHVFGLGPLETLMRDEGISDIMVNGAGSIYVEREGRLELIDEVFGSEEQLKNVIDRMVGRMGRRVDISSPLCDVRHTDGSRINVALAPVSLSGPVVTIRRFRPLFQTMTDLIRVGSLSEKAAMELERAVRGRENIVIAGNSGAGKTTLLNVLSDFIEDTERIVTLEDAAELKLRKDHVIRFETRPGNLEGEGEISMHDLVTNALRMRPDRIIVGECRGREVIPMLQAMNTGHDGSMTTLHANSVRDAVQRLEALVLIGAPGWPIEVVRQQMAAAIDLLVFLKREGGTRELKEMVRISYREGVVRLTDFESDAEGG